MWCVWTRPGNVLFYAVHRLATRWCNLPAHLSFTSKAWFLLPNFDLQMQILFKECSILSLWFTVFPLPLASCDTLWPVVSPLNCTIGNLQVVVVLFAAFVRLRKCRCSLHWLSIFLWKVYGDEKLFLIARFAIIFRGLKRDAEALICLWYASIEA